MLCLILVYESVADILWLFPRVIPFLSDVAVGVPLRLPLDFVAQ